jgi:hypothetical protein
MESISSLSGCCYNPPYIHYNTHSESIYDHKAAAGRLYDVAYFGASFMLMPDPVQCLKHVKKNLKVDGTMYFTQTFQEKKVWVVDILKPIMYWLTTVDFGKTTYPEEFFRILEKGGVTVTEMHTLSTGFLGVTSMRLVSCKLA